MSSKLFRTIQVPTLVFLAVAILPAPAASQDLYVKSLARASTSEQFAILGVNCVLGGLTSGLLQLLDGGSFLDGLAKGAVGGGMLYAGKRIAGTSFSGSGFLAREVAAVGNSIVANASAGRPVLSRVRLPLAFLPGRVVVAVDRGVHLRPIVDAVSAAAFLYGLISPAYRFDLDWSLSSGAAVFTRAGGDPGVVDPGITTVAASAAYAGLYSVEGATTIGAAVLFRSTDAHRRAVLAHEQVHVLQFDFLVAAWGDRGDDLLLGDSGLGRYLRVNSIPLMLGGVSRSLFTAEERRGAPWEVEARKLAGT
jgi:hypothetical protein